MRIQLIRFKSPNQKNRNNSLEKDAKKTLCLCICLVKIQIVTIISKKPMKPRINDKEIDRVKWDHMQISRTPRKIKENNRLA